METLKRHWLIILITICSTVLAVYVVAMLIVIFAVPNKPVPLIAQNSTQTSDKSTTDLKIKGNRNSKIYHLQGCPNYNDIADKNIVWFKTKEEAEAAGYRMAKNC